MPFRPKKFMTVGIRNFYSLITKRNKKIQTPPMEIGVFCHLIFLKQSAVLKIREKLVNNFGKLSKNIM